MNDEDCRITINITACGFFPTVFYWTGRIQCSAKKRERHMGFFSYRRKEKRVSYE
jgi:hypothetical protein